MAAEDFDLKFKYLEEILLQEKYLSRKEKVNFINELKEIVLDKIYQFIETLSPNFGSYNKSIDSILYNPFVFYGFRIILFALVLYVTLKLLKSLQSVIAQFLKSEFSKTSDEQQDINSEVVNNNFNKIENINGDFLLSFLDKEGVVPTISLLRSKLLANYYNIAKLKGGEGLSDRSLLKVIDQKEIVNEKKILVKEVIAYFEKSKFEEKKIEQIELLEFLKKNIKTINKIFSISKEISHE